MITIRLLLVLVFVTAFLPPALAEDLAALVPKSSCGSAEKTDCSKCQPVWPQASLRNEEQGTVVLAFLIDTDGKAIDSKIVKTSGYRRLDAAARYALAQCTYKPGTADGKPVMGWMQTTFIWKLE